MALSGGWAREQRRTRSSSDLAIALGCGVHIADPPRHEGVRTFAEWARARMRRARQEEADRQAAPQHLTIFGPNGKPLKTMLVEGEDEEPQVKDPGEHDAERPRP
jgi:hypothetical protein